MEPQSEQTSSLLRSQTVPIGNHVKHVLSGRSFYPGDDFFFLKFLSEKRFSLFLSIVQE